MVKYLCFGGIWITSWQVDIIWEVNGETLDLILVYIHINNTVTSLSIQMSPSRAYIHMYQVHIHIMVYLVYCYQKGNKRKDMKKIWNIKNNCKSIIRLPSNYINIIDETVYMKSFTYQNKNDKCINYDIMYIHISVYKYININICLMIGRS